MAKVEIDSENLAIILDTIEFVEKLLSELNEGNISYTHFPTRELDHAKRLIRAALKSSEGRQEK